jgi:Domain of unknown function (DUF1772)
MIAWEVPMVLAGALFTGGVVWFAWMRIPAWKTMAPADAEADFADSIRRADRVQPALLVITLAGATAFSLNATGSGRALALGAIAGLVLTLVGSGAILVPLQRRIIRAPVVDARVEELRRLWSAGHLVRTTVALTSFVLLTLAATA